MTPWAGACRGPSCCTAEALGSFALEATLESGGLKCECELTADAAVGAVRCRYVAPSEGLWRLHLQSGGVHLKDSPNSIKVGTSPRWLSHQHIEHQSESELPPSKNYQSLYVCIRSSFPMWRQR